MHFDMSLIIGLLYPLLLHFNLKYSGYVVIILILRISKLVLSVRKSNQSVRLFALNGILLSFTTALFNVIFLAFLNMSSTVVFLVTRSF